MQLAFSTLSVQGVVISGYDEPEWGAEKNISTPSVADVNCNNSNNFESSTSTLPAYIPVCAPIRLLSNSGQCASAAPHRQPQAVAHTARHQRTRGPRRAAMPQWNGERAARSINLKETDEVVSMRFGRAYTAAGEERRGGGGGSRGQGMYPPKGADLGLLLKIFVAVFFSVPDRTDFTLRHMRMRARNVGAVKSNG